MLDSLLFRRQVHYLSIALLVVLLVVLVLQIGRYIIWKRQRQKLYYTEIITVEDQHFGNQKQIRVPKPPARPGGFLGIMRIAIIGLCMFVGSIFYVTGSADTSLETMVGIGLLCISVIIFYGAIFLCFIKILLFILRAWKRIPLMRKQQKKQSVSPMMNTERLPLGIDPPPPPNGFRRIVGSIAMTILILLSAVTMTVREAYHNTEIIAEEFITGSTPYSIPTTMINYYADQQSYPASQGTTNLFNLLKKLARDGYHQFPFDRFIPYQLPQISIDDMYYTSLNYENSANNAYALIMYGSLDESCMTGVTLDEAINLFNRMSDYIQIYDRLTVIANNRSTSSPEGCARIRFSPTQSWFRYKI